MTTAIIITLCVLVLIAYIFDLSASKTRIPAVILLLGLGYIVRQLTGYFSIALPDLSEVLPVLGTIGLILIVLEGSLELELTSKKGPVLGKSFLLATVPMLLLAFGLAYVLRYFGEPSLRINLLNAIPLCVISSAIAIPSVKAFNQHNKEFVIYESSLSDIIGVLFFNFVALNTAASLHAFGDFFTEILVITLVSFLATAGLAFLLNKIEHHIKFIPIIMLVILIYEVSKIYHLPGLIFILIFGLFLGNLDELSQFKLIKKLNPEALDKEVKKFKEITTEAAFLIRALFFILFGFLIDSNELLNPDTFLWAVCIVATIFILRGIQLALSKLPLSPLLFIAPRGLITILLFLSIEAGERISLVNRSLIIQVILLTAFIMMIGLLTHNPKKELT